LGEYPLNKAGAKYGTGYCDAQCPHDIKFINGEANILDWTPSPNDPNSGTGHYGTCCIEMDIWESNSLSSAYTPHVCTVQGQTRCEGVQCGDMPDHRYDGVCDKDGCDYNSFRQGNKTFFGPSMNVDTTKPFSVVTQFVTTDGTDGGTLKQINRFYVQNGKKIPNSFSTFPSLQQYNFVSDSYCTAQKSLFGDRDDFEAKGGLKSMGQALDRGVVLVMSLWDDHEVYMLWLDSDYPTTASPNKPGIARGPCSIDSGRPEKVEQQYPGAHVIYSNIRYGPIGSTTPVGI